MMSIDNCFLKGIILVILIFLSAGQNSVPPVWMPNDYFEAYAVGIKTDVTTTFNDTNPITKSIPFKKYYSTIPKLAYGIKNYRGIIFLMKKEMTG